MSVGSVLLARAALLRKNASVYPHVRHAGRHRCSLHRLYVSSGRDGKNVRYIQPFYVAPANFDTAQAKLISVADTTVVRNIRRHEGESDTLTFHIVLVVYPDSA